MTEELEQLLKNLRLRRILEIYDEQLKAAEKEDVSYSEFVTRLVRAQWHARQEGALEWRIRRANLPERLSLETFPFARQPGVNRKQIRAFAELEFVAKAENIVLVGKTGVGKTGLSCGLLLKALENGYRCQFVRAQDLFDEMYASLADRSTRQLLKRLARLDVLLIDEFGYLNLKPEQSNIFFKLMEERYRQHSTIITTNLGYDEWPNFLGNRPMVEALLSRLRHYCHTVLHRRAVAARAAGLKGNPWSKAAANQGEYIRPGPRRLPQDAGDDGDRAPPGPPAGGPTASARGAAGGGRKCLGLGGGTAPNTARNASPLGTIRSLAYFLPVIEEVLSLRVSPDYFRYLRHKIERAPSTVSPDHHNPIPSEEARAPSARMMGNHPARLRRG